MAQVDLSGHWADEGVVHVGPFRIDAGATVRPQHADTGNMPTPWPRVETDTSIMSVGCARPLEDAYRIAHHDLVGWASTLTGLDTLDAYQLVSQAGRAPIGNVCDPNYTVLAAVDKPLLPAPRAAYDGVHRRLRQLAAGPR